MPNRKHESNKEEKGAEISTQSCLMGFRRDSNRISEKRGLLRMKPGENDAQSVPEWLAQEG
jgi:hypothetical protein